MTEQQPHKPDRSSPWKAVGLVGAIGIDLTVCTLAGFWFGSWLDRLWNGSGIGIAVGVLAGLAVGIVGIIVIIKKIVGDPNE
ncbi:AtpZ/AtpI family protein [Paenibacillus wenxiniae]|uniref:AtpZ/AtpI family protein n=1 Tax=Paenibacillus wenxiniae TaxID=1636843 RepID=A0ABW4RMK5_9BACL